MNKDELRKIYKKKRDELYLNGNINYISNLISKKISESECFRTAKNIMLFYPKGSEIDLLSLLEFEDKNFYLPVCKGDRITVCPYKKGDELVLNKYGIYEPKTSPVDAGILDIVITPAFCADKHFQRIGYGKGYYDRFFCNKNLKAKKLIPLPDEFCLDFIPCDRHDMPCDLIVTEKLISHLDKSC